MAIYDSVPGKILGTNLTNTDVRIPGHSNSKLPFSGPSPPGHNKIKFTK